MKDSMVFYRAWFKAIRCLPENERLQAYEKILSYGLEEEIEVKENPTSEAILTLVKPQIDANNKRYENGKKGGRPKEVGTEDYVGENQTTTEPKSETKVKPSDNQTETKPKPNNNQTITKVKPRNNQEITKTKPNETNPEPNNVYVYVKKEISTKVDTKKETTTTTTTDIAREIAELKESQVWIDNLQTLHHIPISTIREYLDKFHLQCMADGRTRHDSLQDAKSHFNNWLRLQLSKQQNDEPKTNRHDKRRGCSPADGGFTNTF